MLSTDPFQTHPMFLHIRKKKISQLLYFNLEVKNEKFTWRTWMVGVMALKASHPLPTVTFPSRQEGEAS
jgi:hypothetical protein